jgi:hypothetical protein
MPADSDITVSNLTLSPGVDQTFARWSVDDPNLRGLQYLQLDKVELWSATVNNRADSSFAKVGEGIDEAIHYSPGLGKRYYWARPRNKAIGPSGARHYGDWYPLPSTGGLTLSGGEWVDYRPSFSAGSGTISSALVLSGRYYKWEASFTCG